jgi:phosphatidylinositol alpha-1,6-mannosyltransferase
MAPHETGTDSPAQGGVPTTALLTNEYMPSHGGVERLLHQRVEGFHPERVTVFAPHVPGCEEFDQQQSHRTVRARLPRYSLRAVTQTSRCLQPFLALLRHHRKTPYDVVECGQAFPTGLFALFLKRVYGVEYVMWVHGNDLIGPARYAVPRLLIRRALANASLIVTNSAFTRDVITGHGISRDKIRIVQPQADLSRFRSRPRSTRLMEKYGLSEHSKVLLTVGRLVERKGVDTVIGCLPELLTRHEDLRYLVVGDGPERDRLQALAESCGVRNQVNFTGPVSDEELPGIYNLATVFIMPSRFMPTSGTVEGLGLVYLEAMASGVPVIGGNSGGVPDVISHMHTGMLIEPGSTREAAQAVDQVLSDEFLAKRLGDAGRACASDLSRGSWQKVFTRSSA